MVSKKGKSVNSQRYWASGHHKRNKDLKDIRKLKLSEIIEGKKRRLTTRLVEFGQKVDLEVATVKSLRDQLRQFIVKPKPRFTGYKLELIKAYGGEDAYNRTKLQNIIRERVARKRAKGNRPGGKKLLPIKR